MARTSRYNTINTSRVKEITTVEKVYKTAIYARLSVEDLGTFDEQTALVTGAIENQIFLVNEYIKTIPCLKLCGTFIDNGQSGTDFNREGFKRLMEAVKRGDINCIVVKDLSRLGRDYIETGNYLEKVFPFLGVRFISVNDGYDSHKPTKTGDNITFILKNLINDIYARDISKKIKSVYETKQKKGEFIGNYAPYGYLKSPEDKHKLIINKETAPVIRDIFQWKLNGISNLEITRKLNEQKVMSPRNYLYSKNIISSERYAKRILWNMNSINEIFSNLAYIGHMAQGKTKNDINTGIKHKNQSRDKWFVVENTHEPIIEQSVFYAVNEIINKRTDKYRQMRKGIERGKSIFVGIVYCPDCGRTLSRKNREAKNGKTYYSFICPTYAQHLSAGCSKKNIPEETLKKAVSMEITQQILLLCGIENEINAFPQINNKENELLTECTEIKQNLSRLSSRKNSLYDDFKDGLLTETEYNYTRKKCGNEINLLKLRLNEITDESDKCNKKAFSENKHFVAFENLSREMLTTLVDKIYVYHDNRIQIDFKYTVQWNGTIF
ncbi:MAG: recombinase family protein [Oscillospiraceae bacterium]|nr:recombinase family protein [Oscillospiraceae bacterium]